MPRMKRRDFERIKEIAARGGYTVDNELIRGLVAHAEAIDKELDQSALEYGQAMQNIDRLTENVAELKRELDECHYEVVVEPDKVSVSQAVADSISFYRKNHPDKVYEVCFIKDRSLDPANEHAVVLAEFIFWKGYQTYFRALINGYTVEKTKEERLREGITDAVAHLIETKAAPESNELKIKMLSDTITAFVTKFNDENK